MLEALAPIVITAIPTERIVYVEFSMEIPDSLLEEIPQFINTFKGIHCTNIWNSSEYGFKVSHNRAWLSLDIAKEIRSFLADKKFDEILTQVEGEKIKIVIVPWNN